MKRGPRRFLSRRGRQAPQDKISNLRLSRLFGARLDREPDEEPNQETAKSPVVVGLGNPGRSYERTRHNVGFLVVDELARRYGGSWRAKKKAEAAPVSLELRKVTLLKPTTYMNNSGAALAGYKAEQLVVLHDDLDLPAGTVRVKVGGGAGGHNGLRSIIQHLGNDFVRVRIGIGRPPVGVTVTDYVLGRMEEAVKESVSLAADAVEVLIESGSEAAMNQFNVRS
ncbi:MAG TPA: aminoacyl-tRNA hydrolase [Rubrobacteraceae bacterium]|nr:aminoacyl-tRNA hydrolase [Rubrobacteraceae bacterium]